MKALRVLLFSMLLAAGAAHAEDADDHDRARQAYERGEIVALGTILSTVEKEFDGQVIEVELERESGRWVYEVELLTRPGRVLELVYDAATGKLLETDGKGADAARKSE